MRFSKLSRYVFILQANATRALLSNQEKREHNLAVMLLVVVLIFFICNISALIINIIELFSQDVTKNQQFIQVITRTVKKVWLEGSFLTRFFTRLYEPWEGQK